ncbi:ribonuclease D [Starkeya koreensis]|uniref:Ribonuclease D n=1 Tax=Ancylobacter koreensis TaxID=266121 RepID=A0ABT0DJW3_9HYPH|nr:ribonuclease D [Ancylobacter koreensis]MCK0207577.1 ribonuclease D [Ancylobacter koreensis]
MSIRLHRGDLVDLSRYAPENAPFVAIDTETLGLNPHRDRLCVVQLSPGDGTADVVQIPAGAGPGSAPNLERLLTDPRSVKLFHFARFDVAVLGKTFGLTVTPVWCTKIASRLTRTYTDRHGLKELTRELLGIDLSKQQQSSDWAAEELSDAQLQYAASDVLHLHALQAKLAAMLAREGRGGLAQSCFDFLPTRAALDLAGWPDEDIFAHT